MADPEGAGRPGGDREPPVAGAAERRRRAVDQHAPAARRDRVRERREQRLPRAARVAEELLPGVGAADRAPQPQLAPQPHHRDLVAAVAELPAQQRPPDRRPRGAPHPALDPRPRRHALERRRVVEALQREHRDAHAHAVQRRQRPEAQEVERRHEGMHAPLGEHGDARGQPLDLAGHPELRVERGDVAVRAEQVVVVALEAVAAADVDRRRLATQPRPALVDVDRVARVREPARGNEAADAGPEDRDPHRRAPERSSSALARASGGGSTLSRSRTTYRGRRLTSS